MKARRSLGPREEARAGKAEQHPGAVGVMVPVSGDGPILNGRWLFYGARGPAQTPMEESYNAFTWAVTRVRQAPEAQDAREALDEVEKSILALRCLFWETKASKRD